MKTFINQKKKIRDFIKEKKKYVPDLIILFIVLFSLHLGITYSTYHTDPWHWGVIAGLAIDYINNFKLFKDIYILYGPGLPILFSIINFFYEINYYTIGTITSIIYVLNLLFIYLISIKISNKFNALIIVLIFFSFTHYPQTPWPDFYAGLCITFSVYFLNLYINKKIKNYILISSLLLILSITFRTTYLFSIITGIILYLALAKFFKINISNHIKEYFFYSTIFILTYFFLLLMSGNLKLWYVQGLANSYQLITKYYINNYDISYLYLFSKFIYHFILPKKLENFYFLILFISNFIFIYFFIRNDFSKIKVLEKNNILLYAILGLTGLIQSIYQTDIFRNSMSCVSIFFVFIFFLNEIKSKKVFFINLVILILLTPLFPTNSFYSKVNIFPTIGYINKNNEHIKNKDNFYETNIKFFGKHKFNEETREYYANIKNLICNYKKIVNYSIDRTLIYICDKPNLIPSPASLITRVFVNSELENKYKNKNIEKNEIIIADKYYFNSNLILIKKIRLPSYTRFTKSDLFRQEFDNYIYIYVNK